MLDHFDLTIPAGSSLAIVGENGAGKTTLAKLICRLYDTKPVLKQQRLSNNHLPLFSDEELLTMYLFGHLQGLTTQRRMYDYIRNHWREWFPALPTYQNRQLPLERTDSGFRTAHRTPAPKWCVAHRSD